jgi:transcription antitermination factor NusG
MHHSVLPSDPLLSVHNQMTHARLWHVLYVLVNSEKKVKMQLDDRGIQHYLPMREEIRRWSDRRVTINAPLFPGYLFVQCSPFERNIVIRAAGVVRFVTRGLAPAIVPDEEFARIRRLLESQAVTPHDHLEPGKRVRLNGGIFDGFEGTYLREKGKLRAIVAIDWLQRSVIVDVDACDLQPSARYAYVAKA